MVNKTRTRKSKVQKPGSKSRRSRGSKRTTKERSHVSSVNESASSLQTGGQDFWLFGRRMGGFIEE